MHIRRSEILGISLTMALFLHPQLTHAGWGDLLKSLEQNAPELLKNSSDTVPTSSSNLDTDTLVQGLKQALEVGTQRAVASASKTDGYFANPAIRIPLPDAINRGSALLRQFGMGSMVDEFELSMNRAAEQAAPQASAYFLETLKQMSIEDAREIYQGSNDAATRYFQERTSAQLEAVFKPSISEAMEQVGATRYYQALVIKASQYPLVGDMDLNLENHVTSQALVGLFLMLAEEEKKIRADPLARSTDLLRQVFGH